MSAAAGAEMAKRSGARHFLRNNSLSIVVFALFFAFWLYENSLALCFVFLFLLSFLLHAAGGAREYSAEQMAHGGASVTMLEYMSTSQFWFESFQNWQSEFLALGAMAVLSIFLRQRGSPESKPVDAPHSQTGAD